MSRILLAVVSLLIIVIGVAEGKTLAFKPDLVSTVIPSLLASLLTIAAVIERATAVLDNIWYGAERTTAEDGVRAANRQIEETKAAVGQLGAVAQKVDQTGNQDFFKATTNAVSELGNIRAMTAEVATSEQQLTAVQDKETTTKLQVAFIVALAVSAVGVRVLEQLVDTSAVSGYSLWFFHAIDIVLTAGLLAGGTSGISSISDLLSTYMNASRKRALQ